MQTLDGTLYSELNAVRMSSPTCEDLGIPRECEEVSFLSGRVIRNQALHIDGLRYDAVVNGGFPKTDPFSSVCLIPLPYALQHLEPCFVRKRNERERERVRCVNDGYIRLKEHLPLENKSKRISKVETLRRAIEYIRHLESILAQDSSNSDKNSVYDMHFDDSCDNTSSVSDYYSNSNDSDASVCDGIISGSDNEHDNNVHSLSESFHRKRCRSGDDTRSRAKRDSVQNA